MTYREIIREDGPVDKDELIKMLRVDELIPEVYRNEKDFNEMADSILENKINKSAIKNERRMKLYKQGLTNVEMAKKEKITVSSMNVWLRARGLNKKAD